MTRLVYQTLALVTAGSTVVLGAQAETSRRIDDIRDAVLRLPYYGVFDAISFSYDKGSVTLEGYAYGDRR